MKSLKIENDAAYFCKDGEWIAVTEMTKEDLLNLAHVAVEDDDFSADTYVESLIKNPAQKIIYKHIYAELTELHKKREEFREEAKKIYKDAYDKYCQDS